MDLAQPLSSLIPSIDGDVLTVLARTEAPLTGRGVAALSRRGSPPAVKSILDRLVDHGIVLAQPAGPSVLYTLNREHVLSVAVIAAVGAREAWFARLREHIEAWPIPATHASLFGPAARGEAGPHSDVNVVVVRPEDVAAGDPAWAAQLDDLERKVASWTGNQVAWLETDRAGLATATCDGESVLEAIRTDGFRVTGERIHTLIASATNGGQERTSR